MGIKILIVDDHQIMRSMITNMLKSNGGYTFVEASNGQQALEILRDDPEIRLILCDVNMPEMDGVQFLDERKSISDHANTPVMMITSERGKDLIDKCKEKGVETWITKPFKKEDLIEAVAVALY